MVDFLSQNKYLQRVIVMVLTTVAYVTLLYFTPRSNFYITYALFVFLFFLYFYTLKNEKIFSLSFCICLGIGLRLIAVFSMPVLSDDYFRFIWDGKMMLQHINPFQYLPSEVIASHHDPYLQYLYNNLIEESQQAYSVYPATLQYVFGFAVYLFPKNIYAAVVVMKLIIFTAECFTIFGLYLLLRAKKMPLRNICICALNPLIIAELVGNIHFEGLLICFLIFTFYFLEKNKILAVALFWALAINTKLLPLMLAPLFMMYLGFWRFVKTGIVTTIIVIVMFLPFIDQQLLPNLSDTVGKFYNLFEFNASLYYLFVKLTSLFTDGDYSQTIAMLLGAVSMIGILFISFKNFTKEKFYEKALWIFFIYFLSAAMVQPWYISTMIMLCIFSRFKFPLVFSLLVLLSYYPYLLKVYDENMFVIFLEYSLLFIFMIYEYRQVKKGRSFLNFHTSAEI